MSDYTEILREVLPQGTIVAVETIAPGRVTLAASTGAGPDYITARAALTVGAEYDQDHASVADVESAVALVRKLAEHLYGNPHALGVSETGR